MINIICVMYTLQIVLYEVIRFLKIYIFQLKNI